MKNLIHSLRQSSRRKIYLVFPKGIIHDSIPSLCTMDVTEDKVHKCLQKLRADKSPIVDGISPRMLVEISEEIVVPLTIIFKESLDTESVADDWRNANVCPIFKKGKRNSPENYRPVSLTSQICKLLELLIRDELVTYLELHHLIYDSQRGFRKGRSCLTNLLMFLDSVQ